MAKWWIVSADIRRKHYVWTPDYSGHYLFYASLLAEELSHEHVVTVCTAPSALESIEFKTHLEGKDVEIIPSADLQTLLRSLRPGSGVTILHGDLILPELLAMRFPRGCSISVLIMRPPRVVESLFRRTTKRFLERAVSHRSGIRIAELQAVFEVPRSRYQQVPDPAPVDSRACDKDRARQLLGLELPAGTSLGGVIGGLSARKRPDLVLGAAELLDEKFHFLVAGRIEDSPSKNAVTRARSVLGGRLHVLDGYISNEQFSLCFAAVDYTISMHAERISSGIALQSFAMATPIIVASDSELASFVVRNGLGRDSKPDVVALARAIETITLEVPVPSLIELPGPSDFVRALIYGV